MNMQHKKGVFEEKCEEYWKAKKKRKGLILSSLVEVTGLTRKACIKRFRFLQLRDPASQEQRGRPRYYTSDVIAALHDVWEIGSEACGENLHSQIGEYIDIQIREKNWKYDELVTFKLRRMSVGSVKCYVSNFTRTRRNFGGKGTTQKSSVISMVPIRMDGWDKAESGVTQVDTVAHCGDTVAGDYSFTTNGTDVATLWGTRRAQWCKGQEVTKVSLEAMRNDSAFPWTEMHPDSGNEFINAHCIAYAQGSDLRMTRSRPGHKNDNMYVEERNGHVVRKFVGYVRLDCKEAVGALNELYEILAMYLNHFVPVKKCLEKIRIGSKYKRVYEKKAKTPYQRVLEHEKISNEVKEKLKVEHQQLNPLVLHRKIEKLTANVYTMQKRHGKSKNQS